MANKIKNILESPSYKDARKRSKDISVVLREEFKVPGEVIDYGHGKHYFIKTYGCQMNERDSENLSAILEEIGYTKTNVIEEADFILLNTCAIREGAENKVFGQLGAIKNLKRTNPNLILGICGCMPQEEVTISSILKTYNYIDIVFGTHNMHNLPHLLKEALYSKEMVVEVFSKEGEVFENLPSNRASNHKAFVNIMYGCNKFCAYCIVPYTRGKERSRKMEDIIVEINELVAEGYKEVTLLGQNVNAYGKDLIDTDYGMEELLAEVSKTSIPRIRFMTSHPWDFTDEMIGVIARYDNIMPFIHLPVQSGNTEVLSRMARRYSKESYIELFDKIKTAIPHASFTTDIIVGFPGETEEQFLDTLDLYEHCQYDGAYTFVFSPRTGTPAAEMEDNVEMDVKKKRLYRLNERVNHYAREKNMTYIDKTVKVLVDGYSKNNDEVLTGYTETNKVVNFKGNEELIGEIVKVKILDAKTWSLTGEYISE